MTALVSGLNTLVAGEVYAVNGVVRIDYINAIQTGSDSGGPFTDSNGTVVDGGFVTSALGGAVSVKKHITWLTETVVS